MSFETAKRIVCDGCLDSAPVVFRNNTKERKHREQAGWRCRHWERTAQGTLVIPRRSIDLCPSCANQAISNPT